MNKQLSICLVAVLVFLLAGCVVTQEGILFKTADPRLSIGFRLQPPPPLSTTEPQVEPPTATVVPTPTVESLLPTITPTPGCVNAKGNISASGEKIYHCPGQANYDNVKIDKEGEAIFATEQEAIDAGFRKALR